MLAPHSAAGTQHRLLARLAHARSQTDQLFDLVKPYSLYERPVPERHRIIFYLGHLEAFDWNLLHGHLPNSKPLNPEFDRLFAFGIDPVGGGLPTDKPTDWPTVTEVRSYASRVRQTLDAGLATGWQYHGEPEEFSASTLLNVAIEHRLMHAETFTYMLHQLPIDRKIRQRQPRRLARAGLALTSRMIEIPAGPAKLGLSRASDSFGWDNEYEAHTVDVPSFAIDEHMVTNGQFLQFTTAGGYDDRSLWTDADWQWKTGHDISHPAFWSRMGDSWWYRTMFDERPLPTDWPVYVSQAEASAYARWAGKLLPTEAQWHRAAYGTPEGHKRPYPWGSELPNVDNGNFDFRDWDPAPVNAFPQGRSAFGVSGLLGNGWEWTSSRFEQFEGFRPFPFYRGYSADFFDGKHYVIKGGSARTAACMLRRSFRNWFQPHYQYVYAGFRCVSR
jgi:ergothioneine biosynthesis protein EgtB